MNFYKVWKQILVPLVENQPAKWESAACPTLWTTTVSFDSLFKKRVEEIASVDKNWSMGYRCSCCSLTQSSFLLLSWNFFVVTDISHWRIWRVPAAKIYLNANRRARSFFRGWPVKLTGYWRCWLVALCCFLWISTLNRVKRRVHARVQLLS